jgi:hypothetical protein
MAETIIVTRHKALPEFLFERGMCPAGTPVIEHATKETVRGKHVIGVTPLWLAAEAETVTEVPMSIPAGLRGVELTVEEMHKFAGEPVTYKVTRLT